MDLIRHDCFDSARSARIQAVDKKGNLWMQVDSENYIYTPDGKWLIPNFPTQAGSRSAQVLSDASGNLLASNGKKLYALHL